MVITDEARDEDGLAGKERRMGERNHLDHYNIT